MILMSPLATWSISLGGSWLAGPTEGSRGHMLQLAFTSRGRAAATRKAGTCQG